MVKKFMLLATLVLWGGLTMYGSSDAAPLGLIPEPIPGREVSIETDQREYTIGDKAELEVRVNPGAYVYVFNVNADGEVRQIFPNWYARDPYLPRGTHTIPDRPTYRLRVTEPEGDNVLQVIASPEPLDIRDIGDRHDPFPQIAPDRREGEARILGLVPEPEFATDWTTFTVVSEPKHAHDLLAFLGLLEQLIRMQQEQPEPPDDEPCIDINSASFEELQEIVHIGPASAGEIIELRRQQPFRSLDDLQRVSGIGPARLADIKEQGLACVEPADSGNHW